MAEKGKQGFPILKRKVVFKPLTPKQALLKDSVPVKEDGVIQLISSDSDSEVVRSTQSHFQALIPNFSLLATSEKGKREGKRTAMLDPNVAGASAGGSRPRGSRIQPASLKRKDSVPMEEDGVVQLDSSDSDSEGFVDTTNGSLSQGSGKAPKEAMQSGKKPSLDSLKTGTKTSFETPATKGGGGTGGKAYASGKASGKGGLPRATAVNPAVTEVELKLEMDIPKDARVLMDCEAATILQGIQESLTVLSDDPNIKMPGSFNKALEYCKARNNYINTESVRRVLETLKEYGVTDGEICMIGNVCPETIEEVYALIPSLKANKYKNEGPIREMLVNLANVMRS